MTDVNVEEFQQARTKFLADLNSLVIANTDLEVQQSAWKFVRSAYDFARLRRLFPDQTWSHEQEETQFNEQFEHGIRVFSTAVKGMCSIPRAANLYTVKLYLSAFEFIRTDLRQLYQKSSSSSLNTELKTALNELERRQDYLNRRMEDWEFDRDFQRPNQSEKPCLNGIPKEHKWWHKELGIRITDNNNQDSDSDLE